MGLAGQYHPPGFAAWTTPEWVVISGDRRSRRPEVAAAYQSRGAAVLNTAQQGAVTVTIGSRGVQVHAWRQDERGIAAEGDIPASDDADGTLRQLEGV